MGRRNRGWVHTPLDLQYGQENSPDVGGSALTPGNTSKMPSLRTEYAGALAILLVLYDIQVYTMIDNEDLGEIIIWLENVEVFSRARRRHKGNTLQDTLVLDFHMWAEIKSPKVLIKFPIKWEKIYSHISTSTYQIGKMPNGGRYSIQLNEYIDKLS